MSASNVSLQEAPVEKTTLTTIEVTSEVFDTVQNTARELGLSESDAIKHLLEIANYVKSLVIGEGKLIWSERGGSLQYITLPKA